MATQESKQREWRVKGVIGEGAEGSAPSLSDQLMAAQRRMNLIAQQLDGMGRRVDGISYEVEKIRPAADRTLSDHQMVQAIIQSTETLALHVQGLVTRHELNEIGPEIVALNEMQHHHALARTRRQREVEVNLRYIARLERCTQETVDVCPCGKHKGIRFVEYGHLLDNPSEKNTVVLEENMCPKEWWIKQSRLAFKRGELSAFTTAYPFEDYLFAYSL